jgi:hydroxypyruvate isomerase
MAQLQEMLEAVGRPELKMQYDCYHMAMMGEPVFQTLQDNLSQIGHIQFADYPNRQQPSTGTLDFQAIFGYLRQSDYQGWVGAEYRPQGTTLDSLAWFQP